MQTFSTQLTASQASFLQSLLPKNYSFQVAPSDSKRNRLVKKLDESFTADYMISNKRASSKQAHQVSNGKNEPQKIQELTPKNHKNASVVAEQSPNILVTSKNNNDLNQNLLKLLEKLQNCRFSWPFRLPVNPIAQGVPDYSEIIKEPMDLSTIETKLKSSLYDCGQKFHADVKKIISNSYAFNLQESKMYAITQKFQAFYLKICEESTYSPCKNLDLNGSFDKISLTPKKDRNHEKYKNSKQPTKTELTMAQRLTPKQRQRLFHQIYQLSQSDIIKLIKIVDDNALPNDWKQFEIDFKNMEDQKFKKIIKLVNDKGKSSL